MKFLFILISISLNVNVFSQNINFHFFIDAGCQNCILENRQENLWIITNQEFHIPKKLTLKEEEAILNAFKHSVIENHKFPYMSIYSVCIRYDDSAEAIRKNRVAKIEKMQNKGYNVVELNLKLPTMISHPSFESYLNNLEYFGFSGAVLVAEKGKVIHKGFYGWSDAEKRIKISQNSLFPSASIAKAFTAQEILFLNESNLLNLDSSISNYFDGVPENKKEITILQLLSHTSGLRRTILNGNDTIQDKALRKLLIKPLRNNPGERFKYSNAGYQLLALLIEKIEKTSYQAVIRDQILIPSGMSNAGFLNSDFEPFDLPYGYSEFSYIKFPLANTNKYVNIGSRGIVGTIDDYYNWIKELSSIKDYFTKLESNSINTGIEGERYNYGFYFSEDGNLAVTDGDIYGYYSLISWDKLNDRIIILFINKSHYGFGVHKKTIHRNLRQIINNGETIEIPSVVSSNNISVKHYQGIYSNGEGQVIITQINNESKICAIGQTAINDLMDLNEVKIEIVQKKNNQLDSLFHYILKGNYVKAKIFLPEKHRAFFIEGIQEEISEYIDTYGKLINYEIGGTVPLPWQDPNYETIVYLQFEQKKVDMTFAWINDALYETITENDKIYPLIWNIAPIDENVFVHYDMLNGSTKTLLFSASTGKSINQVELNNNRKYLKVKKGSSQ